MDARAVPAKSFTCFSFSVYLSDVPKLLVATRNSYKTGELRELLGTEFKLEDLTDHPEIPNIPETGSTFEENATIKALAVSKHSSELVMADDSGLEVDALDGAPGVYSARYAGAKASDEQNIEKLLDEVRRRDPNGGSMRAARFRCVIVLAQKGSAICAVQGMVEGTITDSRRGHSGFGYDPIFQPSGYAETFGELGAATKNRISHRARAVQALAETLAALRSN
jgi:XTP/dITP diphosphohydrolase